MYFIIFRIVIKRCMLNLKKIKVFKIKEKCFLYFVDLEGQGPLPTYPL